MWIRDIFICGVFQVERGNENQEIPIYIHGEADGRFDRGDYLEFFGMDAR